MPDPNALSFQEIVLRLNRYWADQGCLIWQPHNVQVGAGTMNPATFLRVLGPEPWNVAYVEPSVRPADGRYGENPFRLRQYFQYQVILKPDPGDPQERYLRSLEALGIDLRRHDLRFVEDNWEQPAIGAWGLGWEVWLDAQEVTQFTYFQQAGGQILDPVSVEITYGIERLAMYLQEVEHFRDVRWRGDITYGELFLSAEREHATYEFELADVESVRRQYDLFEAEARRCLERGLVLPAHDYLLRCSHAFNVLDARGAVGVAERAGFFGRMRDLAQEVARLHLEQRAAAGHPLERSETARFLVGAPTVQVPAEAAEPPAYDEPRAAVLEIGAEELPAADVESALEQLARLVPRALSEARLEVEQVRLEGTPRRLAVLLEGLRPGQRTEEVVVKGPPESRAFQDGRPTQAALGFARSQGVDAEALEVVEQKGRRYVAVRQRAESRPSGEVLREVWPGVLAGLRFQKSMRWSPAGGSFARPVRWLLALHGEGVVSFQWAGVASGRHSLGLRGLGSPRFRLERAEDYEPDVASQRILLSSQARREAVRRQVDQRAAELGGAAVAPEGLVREVAQLVEAPHAIAGRFEEAYLEMPRPVLVTVLQHHQRFFPVEDGQAGLLPAFVAVANGDHVDEETVRRGNETVVRGRLADARFFYDRDRRKTLDEHARGLSSLSVHARLGTYAQKVERLKSLAERLAELAQLEPGERRILARATELAKADLVSQLVVELTELQGTIGAHYARLQGEPEPVARAIEEHYAPRGSGDPLPESLPGTLLAIADRLDHLVGCLANDLLPSGSADPFGVRRAGVSLVEILVGRGVDLGLHRLIAAATAAYGADLPKDPTEELLPFLRRRLETALLEKGYRHDVVQSVLAEQGHHPQRAALGVEELQRWVQRPEFAELLPAFARCVRILPKILPKGESFPDPDPALFREEAETQLHHVAQAVHHQHPGQVDELVRSLLPLVQPINWFFDEVLVMDPDPELRRNRLALLAYLTGAARGIMDFSRLEGF